MPILKFRYWDPFNGIMFYSENAQNLRSFFANYELAIKSGTEPIMMQCIGLKDKNDRDIYEGDVVKAFSPEFFVVGYKYSPYGEQEVREDLDLTCVVGNKEFYFSFKIKGEDPICIGDLIYLLMDKYYDIELEVIGNIYDNPELLEE